MFSINTKVEGFVFVCVKLVGKGYALRTFVCEAGWVGAQTGRFWETGAKIPLGDTHFYVPRYYFYCALENGYSSL